MAQQQFDVIICGSGPIGATTAYFLMQANPKLKLAVITQDPTDDHSAAYTQAGGCLRWFWDEPLKREMTETTASFIKGLAAQGVDVGLREDHYLFLYRGAYTPALNFSGQKLVDNLLSRVEAAGATVMRGVQITAVRNETNGGMVETSTGTFQAGRVLLALGINNAKLLPGYKLEQEKRQLFVLDTPVNEANRDFPHVVTPIGKGYAYVFIKRTPQGLRLIVGQEDVLEVSNESGPEDYWNKLLAAGLGEVMPFLKEAKVEQIWWGFDAVNKELSVEEQGHIMAANCGSAARSCVWIGQNLAEQLTI